MKTKKSVDQNLLSLFKAGDICSFEQFYTRNERLFYSYLIAFLQDHDLADDVLQTFYKNLIKNINAFISADNFKYFSFQSLRNCALNAVRNEKLRRTKSTLSIRINNIINIEASFKKFGGEASLESIEEVDAILMSLSDEHREVVSLKIFSDMSFCEIAELTDQTIDSVESRYRRAILKLKQSPNTRNKEY